MDSVDTNNNQLGGREWHEHDFLSQHRNLTNSLSLSTLKLGIEKLKKKCIKIKFQNNLGIKWVKLLKLED